MIQKTIRAFNDTTFTPTEAAEWLQELVDRTKSSQEGYNSIDELASLVKLLELATQALQNGEAGEVFADRAAATTAWTTRTGAGNQPQDGLAIYLVAEAEIHQWDSTEATHKTSFVRSKIIQHEVKIQEAYVLTEGKTDLTIFQVGDKFRAWLGNRYLVGFITAELTDTFANSVDDITKITLVYQG